MAFKMKGFSGFKSKNNLKEIKDDVIKAAPEYIKKKAKSTAITKAAGKLATTAGRKAAGKLAGKALVKIGSRFMPGVGQAMMARDIYKGGKYLYNKLKNK
jgi:hypothetical protein